MKISSMNWVSRGLISPASVSSSCSFHRWIVASRRSRVSAVRISIVARTRSSRLEKFE
ncbi:Uncharacterised protein [Mycobacteroides abscessus subsp. abscessus]|nr:Uncharacterised protein [Mycobacteroides abscessus subsp. abscessus]